MRSVRWGTNVVPSRTTSDTDAPDVEVDRANLAFVGAEAPTEPLLPVRPLQATATFLLLAVIILGAVWVGRRPGPELH